MKQRFLLCVENQGYEASLELRKLYQNIPDKEADRHNQVRIIDESGEDYLYPSRVLCTRQASAADKEQNPPKGSLTACVRRTDEMRLLIAISTKTGHSPIMLRDGISESCPKTR